MNNESLAFLAAEFIPIKSGRDTLRNMHEYEKYMIKFSHLIILSIALLFNACQPNRQGITANRIDIKENSAAHVKPVIENKAGKKHINKSTKHDKQLSEDTYQMIRKLDFAMITCKIKDTSMLRLFDKACAVSVLPDTSWINKQQQKLGSDWDIVVDDNIYYDRMANDTLEINNIPTYIAPREKRFIRFVKADKSGFTIDLTKMPDAWGLILFNGHDNPVFSNSIDIANALKEIYKK